MVIVFGNKINRNRNKIKYVIFTDLNDLVKQETVIII